MKSASLVITVLVSGLGLLVMAEKPLTFRQTATAIAKYNNVFGWKVYKELKGTSGNLLVSPFSLDSVLAMLWSGARGRTAEEIRKVLALPPNADVLEKGFSVLMNHFHYVGLRSNATIRVANKLFTSGAVKKEYGDYVRRHFRSEAEQLDFTKPEAAQTVNSWVEKKTNNRIKNLVGSLGQDTSMLLVNALYFQGRWEQPFESYETDDGEFYVSKDVKKVAKMMRNKMSLPYIENEDYQAIRMKYQGGFSMVVLLPRDVEGVNKLEETLLSFDWDDFNEKLSSHSSRVEVILPKFTMESKLELLDPLRKLGMRAAFDSGADFSGISNSSNLVVSGVVQKTFINVTEEGTEAAAATGIHFIPESLIVEPNPVPQFRADHPFVFILQDDSTKANLFIGRFSQPV